MVVADFYRKYLVMFLVISVIVISRAGLGSVYGSPSWIFSTPPSLDSSCDMRNHDITPLMWFSAKESERVAPSLGEISVRVFCVIICSSKPHLKPAFCFLNMDLIPSLMIYDRGDQCRLRVRALHLRVCVCARAFVRIHVCIHVYLCACALLHALSLMGTCCRTF